MLFSWFTEKGVLAMNPAREVKTEGFSWTEGKTPAFVEGEVQKRLNVIETSTHTGLRDRALLGVLAYTFARIGAVVNLKVEDYYPSGKRFLLRFKEKGGKEKELPVHAPKNRKVIHSIMLRIEESVSMQTFQRRCSGSISHLSSTVGSRLSLLPEDKSHQGLQSGVSDKVSELRMRFAFFYWSETLSRTG
jgi:site-specific recombinase XerD